MSDPNQAVFLSYASQDKEAARRICEALRASGLEVWFDLNELRGGDAWDAKIRKQIRECSLFVPIISSTTNARLEGYFRLEWKLAVDRSHLVADDHPFLFPVAIGDVNEATARVPDRFREVQWTRIRLDETPSELAERIARLLAVQSGHEPPPVPGSSRPPQPSRGRKAKEEKPLWLKRAWQILGLVLVVYYALINPLIKKATAKPKSDQAELAEAMKLSEQAQALVPDVPVPADPAALRDNSKKWPRDEDLREAMGVVRDKDTSQDELADAETEARKEMERHPENTDAVVVLARVQAEYLLRGFDRSEARSAQAKELAERAVQVAPKEPEGLFALARVLEFRAEAPERVDDLLRQAVRLNPLNADYLRAITENAQKKASAAKPKGPWVLL